VVGMQAFTDEDVSGEVSERNGFRVAVSRRFCRRSSKAASDSQEELR